MKKQKKMFRKGTEDAGMKSSYSKLRRVKHIVNSLKEKHIKSADDAIERIQNILED